MSICRNLMINTLIVRYIFDSFVKQEQEPVCDAILLVQVYIEMIANWRHFRYCSCLRSRSALKFGRLSYLLRSTAGRHSMKTAIHWASALPT